MRGGVGERGEIEGDGGDDIVLNNGKADDKSGLNKANHANPGCRGAQFDG